MIWNWITVVAVHFFPCLRHTVSGVRWGEGVPGTCVAAVLHAVYTVRLSVSLPPPLPHPTTREYSLPKLGRGVDCKKNWNTHEKSLISKNSLPRTPHHTCRPVRSLGWLNRSEIFWSQKSMLLAVAMIL